MIREFLRYLSLELNRSELTVEAYSTDLRGFNDFLIYSGVPYDDAGFFIPSAVSSADVREWMVRLSEQGISNTSIRRKMQSLRAYFKFLVKRGIIKSSPAAAVPLPKTGKKLPEIASQSEIDQIISHIEDPLERIAMELLFGCGLRRSELLSLTDTDINPHSKEMRIIGKGNKERMIPLSDELLLQIQHWQSVRDEKYPQLPHPRKLMATRSGSMSATTLYHIIQKALAGSNASKKSPHTLRHSFATSLLNNGADINSVKELLGHSSLAATQIYTHLAYADLIRDWDKAHPRSAKK